jgi:hypothetical protein
LEKFGGQADGWDEKKDATERVPPEERPGASAGLTKKEEEDGRTKNEEEDGPSLCWIVETLLRRKRRAVASDAPTVLSVRRG